MTKPRILIVDDDPGTVASLSRAFALEGYEATTAPSAARALERLQAGPVDAILSDLVMPGMDGLELLGRLREQAPGVPVILMSGQATVETAVKATRLGALDFVEKPVGLDRLLLTLRNALRLDRLERENLELRRYWQDELALIGESPPMASLRALVEQADGGTLFLDEIGDMPAAMQAKLLRVLQDGTLTRVGGASETKVDVRLISATHRDLEGLIAEGRLREDLYYRINTLVLKTPALRERPGDVSALVEHFVQSACRRNGWRPRRFAPQALDLLRRQPWRGNVRELKNVVERALILCDGDPIEAESLP